MSVPEPSTRFGLWPLVRAQTGWPETNEDKLVAMATTWRGAATGFDNAAATKFDALRGAWPDTVGSDMVGRVEGVLGTTRTVAADMTELAGYSTAAATVVAQAKTDINTVIDNALPVYGLIQRMPAAMRDLVQPAFIAGIVRIIAEILKRALSRLPKGPKPKGKPAPKRAPVRRNLGEYFTNGQKPKASELDEWARAQGWTKTQNPNGPATYVDKNGIKRLTIKQGSPRTPGSEHPHVEIRNDLGQRTDPFGNVVTRKSPENHTPIEWDW